MIEKYVNAEELKRLLSTLVVVIGALMVAALFASILVPGLRNANQPPAPMPVNPVVGEPGWLDITEFPPERGKVIPPLDPKTLLAATAELMAKGKELFAQNCVSCHGEQGRGDGPAASSMSPGPRNFAVTTSWVNGHDLPSLYKTLSEGIRGSSMASFDYLSKQDRMALAHYVQSMGAFPHGQGSEQAMTDLTKQLAAAGETTPNKIPVSQAMARLRQEYRAPAPLVINPEDPSPAAEVLRRAVSDPAVAARTLAGTAYWRSGPKELAESILPGAPANGFSLQATALSAAEWQALHAELKRLVPGKDTK
jgi:mono/diheme cytochrome c family protein